MALQAAARSGGKSLCRNWTGKLGSCAWGIDCRFAHDATGEDASEDAAPQGVSKPCFLWTGVAGSCRYGSHCHFRHVVDEGQGIDSASASQSSVDCVSGQISGSPETSGGQLNPLASEFIPGMPVPLFIPACTSASSESGSSGIESLDQRCYTSLAVPLECFDEFQHALESIESDTGAEIFYDSMTQSAVIEGTPEQLKNASTKVMATIEKSLQQCSAECCVCFEAPRKRLGPNRNRDRYGLMEGCDHVVCMQCIMNWRKNAKTAREARLGCPVCRKLSHIVVPWHEALSGEERLNVLHQFKERCRTTPCKWSSGGQRCPAGKHCLYDHSKAPQVIEPRREMQFDSDDEDDALFLFAALSNLTSLFERRNRLTRALLDSDDDVESDEEISAFLRGLRG